MRVFEKDKPYPPNTKHWKVGDLVIHRADEKHHTMLMRITGYLPDNGRVKTVYINPLYRSGKPKHPSVMKQVWDNPLEALLDPKDFGIEVQE
jgi:hypothetical protein